MVDNTSDGAMKSQNLWIIDEKKPIVSLLSRLQTKVIIYSSQKYQQAKEPDSMVFNGQLHVMIDLKPERTADRVV